MSENEIEKVISDGNAENDSITEMKRPIFKGDVFFANLNPIVGNESGGIRPVVVIQNNLGNYYSPTIVAAITSRTGKNNLPTHVKIKKSTGGLYEDSIIMLEQIRTIDKTRLKHYIGHVNDETIQKIDQAIKCSLGLDNEEANEFQGDK